MTVSFKPPNAFGHSPLPVQVLLHLRPDGFEGLPSIASACLQPHAMLFHVRLLPGALCAAWGLACVLKGVVGLPMSLPMSTSSSGRMEPAIMGSLAPCRRDAPVLQHVLLHLEGAPVRGDGAALLRCMELWARVRMRFPPPHLLTASPGNSPHLDHHRAPSWSRCWGPALSCSWWLSWR